MHTPTNDREWLNSIDSLGLALGIAARTGDTTKAEQLRNDRNQLNANRPKTNKETTK